MVAGRKTQLKAREEMKMSRRWPPEKMQNGSHEA
jgi:hypothetical protein